jgi:membrane fusion protein, multidrug efflux system
LIIARLPNEIEISKMKKTLIVVLVVLAIVFLLALPKLGLFGGEKKAGSNAAQQGPQVLPVEAVVIKPSSFAKKLVVTGSILANESIELKSEVSGKIEGIYFTEGQFVKKGDLLIKIDDDELRAQLNKQKFNKKLNEDNEFRQRKLLEKEAISQEEYDNALNRLNTTAADIEVLEAQQAKTTILAPFNGSIGFRYVSEGAYISPAIVMATLYSLNPAKIEFSIPAKHASKVSVRSKIFFTIESDTTHFAGEVYAVEPQIDASTRTLRIRATTPNPKGKMLPGQFVTIQLVLEHLQNAIMVPTESVVPEQDGNKVFVKENGKAKEVRVSAGERTERSLEILAGLKFGDTVLTTGILQLRKGLPVNVTRISN